VISATGGILRGIHAHDLGGRCRGTQECVHLSHRLTDVAEEALEPGTQVVVTGEELDEGNWEHLEEDA